MGLRLSVLENVKVKARPSTVEDRNLTSGDILANDRKR